MLPHPYIESLASKRRYERYRQDAEAWRLTRESRNKRHAALLRTAALVRVAVWLQAAGRALQRVGQRALEGAQPPRPQAPLEQH